MPDSCTFKANTTIFLQCLEENKMFFVKEEPPLAAPRKNQLNQKDTRTFLGNYPVIRSITI